MQVFLEYPWWVFLLGGSFLAALSFLFYRKDKKLQDFKNNTKLALAILRSSALVCLLFLLLNPFLKTNISQTEKPLLAIAFDNTESIILKSDSTDLLNLKNQIASSLEALKENYDIDIYRFGDQVDTEDELDYKFKISDASKLKNALKANYTNRNLAGVVLITDGIFNRGANANRLFDDLNVPIYTLGVGDTSIQKDLAIRQIRNNQIAYLGNDFMVEVAIGANYLQNKSTNISIFKEGEKVESKTISIDNARYFQKHLFTLPTKAKGLQQYSVVVSQLDDEVNIKNNAQSFFIDVLDASQRILILADAPHPDVAAIRSALEKNRGNKVEVRLASKFVEPINWEEYNLVILHQVPGKSNGNKWGKDLQAIQTPVLVVLGSNSNLNFQNSLYSGLKITGQKTAKQEVFVALNKEFQQFALPDDFISLIPKLQPLIAPFGEYKTGNALQSLFYQKIGPVKTAQPLLAFEEVSSKKVGYLTGEGIWRWRMLSFREFGDHKAFDQFIEKVVQYLALKEDKGRFKLISENAIFENERLTFEAELYDETYTLSPNGEVSISIKDSAGVEFPFTFYGAGNKYALDAGLLPPGNYNYNANGKLGVETFTKSGSFTIKPLLLERNNTRADFNLLVNISQNTGGDFYTPNQLDVLFKDLKENNNTKPLIYSREQFFELINIKWLFFVILLLLSIEWFIRKYNGAY